MRQTRDDDALVRLDAIPEARREVATACAAGDTCAGDDLILEGVCSAAVERGRGLKNETVAEALLARLVVILRALDVRFRERSDANRAAQGVG